MAAPAINHHHHHHVFICWKFKSNRKSVCSPPCAQKKIGISSEWRKHVNCKDWDSQHSGNKKQVHIHKIENGTHQLWFICCCYCCCCCCFFSFNVRYLSMCKWNHLKKDTQYTMCLLITPKTNLISEHFRAENKSSNATIKGRFVFTVEQTYGFRAPITQWFRIR